MTAPPPCEPSPPRYRLLSRSDLRERGIRFSKMHLWRLCRGGKFPRPVKIGGGNRNTWIESEIDAYLDAAIASRDAGNEAEGDRAAKRARAGKRGAGKAAAATGAKAPPKAKKPAGEARKGRGTAPDTRSMA
jgi:prophage regulatory protein